MGSFRSGIITSPCALYRNIASVLIFLSSFTESIIFFGIIISHILSLCKCANFVFLICSYRSFDLSQTNLRKVTRSRTEYIDDFGSIKLSQSRKIVHIQAFICFVAKTGKHSVCRTVLEQGQQSNPHIVLVIIVKQTSVSQTHKVIEIICQIVLTDVFARRDSGVADRCLHREVSEGVFKRFGNIPAHLTSCLPKPKG